jgi:hypothetical protein
VEQKAEKKKKTRRVFGRVLLFLLERGDDDDFGTEVRRRGRKGGQSKKAVRVSSPG